MNHNLVANFDEFLEMAEYVNGYDSDILVVDVETDGVQERTAKLFGFALALDDHEAFYIPWRKNTDTKDLWWTPAQESAIIQWFVALCRRKKLVNHNIIFDVLIFYHNWGKDLTDCIYSDTILLKHTIDEEQPHGLKETAVKYLGPWADHAQQELFDNIKLRGGKATKNNMEMWRADFEVLGKYCCWDVLLTRKLFDIFEPRIAAEGLSDLFYKDEIMPLYKEVTIPMKKKGFAVDVTYFKELNEQVANEMAQLERRIQESVCADVAEFERITLDKTYPVKRTGLFPKMYAQMIGFALPEKNGKVTMAAKEIEKLHTMDSLHGEFLTWLKGKDLPTLYPVQRYWHKLDTQGGYVFNLNSADHLKWLFFERYGEKPLNTTEGGEPQVDEDFLDSMVASYPWVQLLIDYKKLGKLQSTYIEGVLERQIDGVIYTSMKQFGTTSGRYASSDPNLQNLPRVKDEDSGLSELVLKYTNCIRAGFIAFKGYKLVDADQSQLEARAFAGVCGDKKLIKSFLDNEDLYGAIAKNIWHLDCLANEVKKKYPEKRQQAKAVALACVYGAEAGRISQMLKIQYVEAQKIIDDYLNTYPQLRTYMSNRNEEACTTGQVATKFGRIRHIPEAKRLYQTYGLRLRDRRWAKSQGLEEECWKFKSYLNLGKNHPIQGMAAHVMNRSAINIALAFKRENIDGYLSLQIHDQLICNVLEADCERAKSIIKHYMETSVDIGLPLIADPNVADNMKDSH